MIFAIIFLVIAVVAVVVSVFAGRSTDPDAKMFRNGARVVAVLAFILVGVMTVVSSANQVPTKEIGVITTFGHPDGELTNGLHFISPFSKVTTLDGAQQNDQRLSASTCTTVRLANQSTACVQNAVQWQIDPAAADQLYKNYKDFANIRSNLVDNNLAVELNTAFSGYDPLASLASQTSTTGTTSAPTAISKDELDKIASNVLTALQADVGTSITIKKVSITIVTYDASTESKISQYQAALANTRIALQNEQTAAAQAAANKILSSSVANDNGVLVSKCYDLVAEMINKGVAVPPGYSCWPGSGSNVLVGAGATK
ncbi:MAG: SPFH domain-containing protein [Candidatus Saccharibacteria bacterium]